MAMREADEETRERRKHGARAFLKTAAQASVGIWLGRVESWCDEHGAVLMMHREAGEWKMSVTVGARIVSVAGASIAEGLARLGMQLFASK